MRDDKSEGWETLKTKHSQIRKVSLGDIYIDPRFQRALGEHRKDQIAAPTRARVREGSRHYLTSAGQRVPRQRGTASGKTHRPPGDLTAR